MTARLLVVMGSGETAPTMVKVHRDVVGRVPPAPPALLLDTPFGFQANADELAARTVAYFAQSIGARIEVAGLRRAADLRGPAADALVSRLAATPLVFSGPGSPTYALRTWRGTLVPGLLREKLALGGALTFSSAAALTLGTHTVPVYEIYKVGEEPRWVPGLDLLGDIDPRFRAAVVPHFDNAEGGTHDTRYCYLGEQRLALLERDLPDDTWVLGVDEHTALVLDLDAGQASVAGLGGVTVRFRGRSSVLPSGAATGIDDLMGTAADLRRRSFAAGAGPERAAPAGTAGTPDAATPGAGTPGTGTPGAGRWPSLGAPGSAAAGRGAGGPAGGSPLVRAARTLQERFDGARSAGDAPGMATAIAELEAELWAWRADPTQSDDQDRVRATLRGMIAALGTVAVAGTRDPALVVGPFVDLALALRAGARSDRRFADADAIRDALTALGVEVRDAADGSTWVLRRGARSPGPDRTVGEHPGSC